MTGPRAHDELADDELVIEVHPDHFVAQGRDISSLEELAEAIHGQRAVRLTIKPHADYKRVGDAIYTVARSGAMLKVDNPTGQA